MDITNPTELRAALMIIAKDAVQQVSNDVQTVLDSNIITYTYTHEEEPNSWYYAKSGEPTWEFLRAFIWDDFELFVNAVHKKLKYYWEGMSFDADTGLHGDPDRGDLREQLADILNIEGRDDGYFVSSKTGLRGKPRHPFWDITMSDLFDKGGLTDFFDDALGERGFFRT